MNIYKFIKDLGPDIIFFELGAHQSEDTIAFLDMGIKDMHVFECDPSNFNIIKTDVFEFEELHPGMPSISLCDMAVNSFTGECTFVKSARNSGKKWTQSGSVKQPKNHLTAYPTVTFGETVTVKCVSLDDYCNHTGVNVIDFIWCDIQGAEIEMINGAQKILEHTTYLYTEYSDNELYEGQATLQQLLDALPNFEVVFDFGKNAQGEGNILLKHK